MKKQILFLSLISFCFVSLSSAQQLTGKATFIEKINKEQGKLVIPYEKYKLDNGLTLIVNEDHSDPIVHVEVFYHVGSTRDQAGRSGFAHFFEHMMFQGSDHVADGEHHRIVGEAGGVMNGNTTVDRTVYFETIPSNYLETALWLEADRMGFMIDAVTQKKFEIQRETVKNERGQNYDNKPYGVMYEKICAALYPPSNPYSTVAIGYIEDLNRANAEELRNFFLRWYGPNNATIVVSGDADTKQVVALTEKYFGMINPGPKVEPLKLEPVTLESDRYISYEDNIRNPALQIVFPTIPTHHPDEAALDVLADILGGPGSGMLSRKFLGGGSPKASAVNVSHPCHEQAGIFNIVITALPDQSLSDIESDARKTIESFEKRGATDDDLQKYKAHFEDRLFTEMLTVHGKAERLGYYELRHGNPNLAEQEYQRYLNVTADDVMRVYKKYIKDKSAVILSVCPKGKLSAAAKSDNYKLPVRVIPAQQSDDYKNLVYVKAKDTFDRSKKPEVGPASIVKTPEVWKDQFKNGFKMMGITNNEVPYVTMQLSVEAGHTREEREKSGKAYVMMCMIDESTKKHGTLYYNTELKKMGSTIQFNGKTDEVVITITSLKKNLSKTLEILEEKLFEPLFDEKEFDYEVKRLVQRIADQPTSSVRLADNVFQKLLYGDGNIVSTSVLGTKESISDISLRDVKKYYKEKFIPNVSSLVVVGDVSKEEILPQLSFFKDWDSRKIEDPKLPAAPLIDKTRIYFINKKGAAQSEIRIGCNATPYDAVGDYFKCFFMNYALGEAFSSRINLNLREDKGFTYGASSYFYGTKYTGDFTAKAGVKLSQSDSSVVEIMKEIKKYADAGPTQLELDMTKRSLMQSEALKFESPTQKAEFLSRVLKYGLDVDYMKGQNDIVSKMTKPEVDAIAKKYLPYNNMVILVVGDKSVMGSLQKLNYEVVELDVNGNKL